MSTMEQWTVAVCADLGLDPGAAADLRAVLDLTRDVAHGVARPAAPLTAYLVGLAVGRGLTLPDATARVSALAAGWGGAEGTVTGLLHFSVSPGAGGPASSKTVSRSGCGRAKGGP